ncbi:MAG: efflux transporter outer membrane subunit [Chitinophagia bacterium]|nr:efflux transporter outer membrane subunit [Chitinophagia bacterium]
MLKKNRIVYIAVCSIGLLAGGCKVPTLLEKKTTLQTPATFNGTNGDSTTAASMNWKEYFGDPYLTALIDTALRNNQELNMTLQEIEIARNEVRARKGEYLPFVGVKGAAGFDKAARYTNIGALEENTEIRPGKETPDPLPDYMLAAYATWEVDIWHKLRNAKKAAVNRYLATVEGKNFVVTNLVAEVANSYYELLALDNQLAIIENNIEIQNNALKIVRLQKEAARTTELAVQRFEAQVLNTKSLQYGIQQRITETENRINFLLARAPQRIERAKLNLNDLQPRAVQAGVPSSLLDNRPDVRQAGQELAAAKLDVQVAKARFYPSLGISATIGYEAYNTGYLFRSPESILYSLAGELAGPLVNRNGIKAGYNTAGARQIQAAYRYEQTLLHAYMEVANQLSNINNLSKTYDTKAQQVQALTRSVDISNDLFKSARADYMEVLLTQRDALEARFDLIETREQQLKAMVSIYQALGGGWR